MPGGINSNLRLFANNAKLSRKNRRMTAKKCKKALDSEWTHYMNGIELGTWSSMPKKCHILQMGKVRRPM